MYNLYIDRDFDVYDNAKVYDSACEEVYYELTDIIYQIEQVMNAICDSDNDSDELTDIYNALDNLITVDYNKFNYDELVWYIDDIEEQFAELLEQYNNIIG